MDDACRRCSGVPRLRQRIALRCGSAFLPPAFRALSPSVGPVPELLLTGRMGNEYARNYEDVTIYRLDPERERELVRKQVECTFIWSTKAGEPVGVIMSYLETDDGKLWLTASEQRARIAAVRRDPRTCVVISSPGTDMGPGKTITYRGKTIVHGPDDRKTKEWFYPPFARKLFGFAGEAKVRQFIEFLDSPRRVVLEFTPTSKIVYDGDKMAAATPPVGSRRDR